MRLAGRRWRVSVSTARLDGVDYRILRPQRPAGHATLRESRFGAQLSLGKAAAVDFAGAWWLAARSPHTLVHLPLRSSATSCGEEYGGRKLDLVLLHHTLGFRAANWKRVRVRRSPPAMHTVTLPPRPFRPFEREDYERFFHREFRDHLHWAVAADTLFVIGSRLAYELAGEEVRALAEEGPARLAEAPGTHCCAEIGLGPWNPYRARNPHALLHAQLCDHPG